MSIITVTYWGLRIPNEYLGIRGVEDSYDVEEQVMKLAGDFKLLTWDVAANENGTDAIGAVMVRGTMSFFDDHGIWKIPKKPVNLEGLRELDELAAKLGLTGEDGPGWLVSVDPS